MKKVAVYLANGFEEVEALTVVDYLRRCGIKTEMISVSGTEQVEGVHGIVVTSDKSIKEISDITEYDGIVFPGGMPGATNLRDDELVLSHARAMNEDKKIVAAICAAPIVMEKAGILEGRNITSFPGFETVLKSGNYQEDIVCVDENIVTSRGPATAVVFALKLVELLVGEKESKKLADSILFSALAK